MSRVVKSNEIELNNARYPILEKVRPALISQFPAKIVVGDYTKESEQIASSWIISDQRGGILVEEIIEAIHQNRCYWSDCNLSYKGHIILPPLAVDCGGVTGEDAYIMYELDGDIYACFDEHLRIFDNDTTDFDTVEEDFSYNPTDVLVFGGATLIAFGDDGNIQQKLLPSLDKFIDNPYFKDWSGGVPTGWGFDLPTGAAVDINTDTDYINKGKFSVKLTGGSSDTTYMRQKLPFSTVLRGETVTIKAYGCYVSAAVKMRIKDGVDDTETGFDGTFQQKTCAHTMNDSATALELEFEVSAGSAHQDGYIDDITIEISGFTDWLDMGTKGKYFTSLGKTLYMIDADGKLYESKVGIEWVEKAEIPVPFGSVTSMFVYRDAYGNLVVYVGTEVGLFVYDSIAEELMETELSLPQHPTAALHPAWWHDGLFVPAGLDVLKYQAATIATITSIGLDKDAGIIAAYQGEITSLIAGYNEFFALVDSTYGATGTSKSVVMAYDGSGWQCKWIGGTADKAMKCGLISSAYDEYRLYFGADNKVYYIALQRNLLNPLKITDFPYRASSIHMTGWFDGGVAWKKLAIELELFCKGIVDDNEEVVVEYRIDHTNTDLDTSWSPLGTIESNGTTTFSFASEVGVVFKNIQFRFSLSRGAGDNTKTPDIQEVKLKYLKLLPPMWGWTFSVDCTKDYDGRSGAQMVEALITAAETETMIDFVFSHTSATTPKVAETHKVRIKSIIGGLQTGDNKEGEYTIQVIEV